MSKNARFLATPRAAKVAKDPLGPMGPTGVARNAQKHEVLGHPKGGQGG